MNNQPEYKMLHELIKLAQEGKKFTAKLEGEIIEYGEKHFIGGGWRDISVIGKWTYKEIKEPQVVEFECIWDYSCMDLRKKIQSMIGKKWKVVCTEILN